MEQLRAILIFILGIVLLAAALYYRCGGCVGG
jgi:hypothetical protein